MADSSSRLLADRRSGKDRRSVPRRSVLAAVAAERRRVVDRRHGPERRSTLERRGNPLHRARLEAPAEHLRNAIQMLRLATAMNEGDADAALAAALPAALARLQRALRLLEPAARR